jgi:Protein of unknown function (DUF2914)
MLSTTTGLAFLLNATSFPGEVVLASSPYVELAVGYRIVDRQIERVDRDHVFVAGDVVYAWSALVGVPSGFVEHVWSKDGKEVGRFYLPVGTNRRWRTWSHKAVVPGEYEVRVIGPDGTALGKTRFSVAALGTDEDCGLES